MTTFDCFTFNNEWDLLRLRLHLLRDVVDHFIVSEATRTFVGGPRSLELTPSVLRRLDAPITVVQVDDMPDTADPWDRERHQRSALSRGLARLGARRGDTVIVTDVDEIPRPEVVSRLESLMEGHPVELSMRYRQYRLNLEIDRPWPLARAAPFEAVKDPQLLREATGLRQISESGWHFTYLGSEHQALVKLRDFAHQELRGIYDTETHLRRCMALNVDLLGRFGMHVLPRAELDTRITELFSEHSDLWAAEPGWRERLKARAYKLITEERRLLGPLLCDRTPAVALPAAAGAKLARRAKGQIKR